jgi:hypothetical protein
MGASIDDADSLSEKRKKGRVTIDDADSLPSEQTALAAIRPPVFHQMVDGVFAGRAT